MSALLTQEHIINFAWLAFVWAFICVVVGSILLARWKQREREDADRTEEILKGLSFDTTHAHDYDEWS